MSIDIHPEGWKASFGDRRVRVQAVVAPLVLEQVACLVYFLLEELACLVYLVLEQVALLVYL